MNKPTAIILGLAFIALVVGLAAVNAIDPQRPGGGNSQTIEQQEDRVSTVYRDTEIGLSFAYDATRYNLEVLSTETNTDVKTIVLTDMVEYQDLIRSDVPREGPPTMSVRVFENDQKERPGDWVRTHSGESMLGLLRGEVTDAVIGGANAVRYTSDGLYPTDTVVVTHGSYVYVIAGAYLDENSPIKKDFGPFLNSIVFIPEA